MAAETAPYGRVTQRPSPVAEVHILWITAGLGCDGDSVSITAASQPSIEDVLLGAIPGLPKVHLHNPVLAYEVGDDFMKYWYLAEEGKLDPFVRLDISAYPTLSGGAAVDAGGHLIGLVSTGLSRSSVFAVTRATIDRIAGKLSQQGYVSRGFLGAALQPVVLPPQMKDKLAQDTGIMLVGIEPEGPAAVGGLILGDVLLAGDGQPLSQPEALADLLERTPPGRVVKFSVLRAGLAQDLDVRLGERPKRGR